MCPEKERYMRVVQKRLSAYECHNDGSIAPELAVKEYSRSAADQVKMQSLKFLKIFPKKIISNT